MNAVKEGLGDSIAELLSFPIAILDSTLSRYKAKFLSKAGVGSTQCPVVISPAGQLFDRPSSQFASLPPSQ